VTVLDQRGERCPLPVIALARAVRELPVGGEVTLLTDDPAAEHDVPAWCRMREQQLVSAADGTFVVRRLV
jgi:tRNA 2-thiouridine synthesizing protein A